MNGPLGASGASLEGLSLGVSGAGITLIFNGGETNAQVTFEVSATGSGSGDSDENFTTALKNKLDAIEASADVTDATNVTSAGALMDSELTSIADVKALNQSVVTSAHPTFAGVSAAGVSADIVDVGDVIKFTSGMTAASIVTTVNGVSGDVTLVTTDQNFTNADHTKLDGIEASADVTDATNVVAAGALMDSELASIADVKALDQSVVSGASPTFGTANFTDASNKRLMTDAQEAKVDSVETNADVTDTANVQAAVTSTHLHVAGISSDGGATFGAGIFVTGGNIVGPDRVTGRVITDVVQSPDNVNSLYGYKNNNSTWVVQTGNSTAQITVFSGGVQSAAKLEATTFVEAGTYVHAGTGISLDAGGITFADGTFQSTAAGLTHTDENFTAADHTKLNGIEASADVTDATNVASAGALMDSELASIADVKALDQSVVSGASPTFGTANFTDASNKRLMTDAQESKLDGVEASADVTDATNVAAAGALMDSELTSIADVKALNQSVVTTAHPTFAGVSAAGVSADIVDVGDQIKFTSGMTAASIVTTVNGVSGDVTISSGGASNNLGIGFVIDGDSAPISTGDKLDGARLINTDSKVISHQVYLQDGITSSNGGTLEVALRKTSTLFGSDSTVTGSAVYMNISGSGVTTHTISTPSAGATYGTLLAPSTANGATVDAAEWVYPYVTTNTANVDKIQIFIRMEDT